MYRQQRAKGPTTWEDAYAQVRWAGMFLCPSACCAVSHRLWMGASLAASVEACASRPLHPHTTASGHPLLRVLAA